VSFFPIPAHPLPALLGRQGGGFASGKAAMASKNVVGHKLACNLEFTTQEDFKRNLCPQERKSKFGIV
jgi:hypothetical protein